MDERKISLLEQMTVANGASPNEEAIAKEKIARYAKAMNSPKHTNQRWIAENCSDEHNTPIFEREFLRRWYELKAANRRKWGA